MCYFICTIFGFIKFVLYLLHNDEKHFYIDYILYKFDKTKIAFEKYCPINTKLL